MISQPITEDEEEEEEEQEKEESRKCMLRGEGMYFEEE
jgi:ribosomal protein L12E/L44/L45/RPP1/RPP2